MDEQSVNPRQHTWHARQRLTVMLSIHSTTIWLWLWTNTNLRRRILSTWTRVVVIQCKPRGKLLMPAAKNRLATLHRVSVENWLHWCTRSVRLVIPSLPCLYSHVSTIAITSSIQPTRFRGSSKQVWLDQCGELSRLPDTCRPEYAMH